jgi:hypothetical protein
LDSTGKKFDQANLPSPLNEAPVAAKGDFLRDRRRGGFMLFMIMGRIFILLVLFMSIFFVGKAAVAIEEVKYTVVEKEGDFELRDYEPFIVAETLVEGDFSAVGNVGFRRLYDYISGNNRKQASISMTAPVTQEARSEKISMTAPVTQENQGGKWRITFMMPSQYSMKTLPEPLDPNVKLKQESKRVVAALRYSGTWSQKRYSEKEARLFEWIEKRGFRAVGEPVFARYNSPFMPWFLRRNEVLIPVAR